MVVPQGPRGGRCARTRAQRFLRAFALPLELPFAAPFLLALRLAWPFVLRSLREGFALAFDNDRERRRTLSASLGSPALGLATYLFRMEYGSMSPVYTSLLEHLERTGIVYQADADREVASATFTCETGAYQVIARVNEEDRLFQVFGICPITIPQGSRLDVCHAITRANWGLKVGKFELDMDEGRLHFHIANVVDGDQVSDCLFGRLIAITLAMLDRYIPAILSVVYGNEPPASAVQRVEN